MRPNLSVWPLLAAIVAGPLAAQTPVRVDINKQTTKPLVGSDPFYFVVSGSKVFVGSKRKRWEFRLNPDDDPQTIAEPQNAWRRVLFIR